MSTTMADGASERLDAQIADALFGQPGMSKLDVANRLLQLRGDGGALLGSAAYPAAWMWPHPEDGSVRFTADGDVATEAANIGRSVAALYRVPVQEEAHPSPAGQVDGLLPCPFCGNSAEFVPYKGHGLTVKCKSMGCIQRHQRTLRYGIEWLRTSMTEHWNARALAARQPVGEQLMEMRICELRHVSLKPNRAYIFTVDVNCANCRADSAYAMWHTDTRPAQAVDLGTGVKAISDERERQLRAEGFSRDGDQQYDRGELARAATAYVQLAAMDLHAGSRSHIAFQEPPFAWPWAPEWWKPVDARRDLVRAGALIAAQIDLIDSKAVQP